MARAQPATLIRYLRRLAAGRGPHQGSDRQLLDDFAVRRDEAAFAALVARHGPMVLRVCRRVLHQEQDAEDAFQAAFLVLARNTGSIRKPEALAEWLHGVAYRTAMKAKRSAARRRNHEARLRTVAPKAVLSPTWDDVQPALDEEIQRLPRAFRTAFVLCVLEGKSGPQAAAELGVKPGTVSSRLARARKLLREQLARRGIELAALLSALSVAENSGQAGVPALLADATVRSGLLVAAGGTAVGVIPAHVAALAAGVSRAMCLTKAKIATAIVLALGLVGAGAGALAHHALASREAAPAAKQSGPKGANAPVGRTKAGAGAQDAERESLNVTGRVLDPEGKPVAGARLYSPGRLKQRLDGPEEVVAVQRGTTDKDGRFRLKVPREEAQPGRPLPLIAAADGYGLAWVDLPEKGAPGEVTLRLVRDVPVRGRIVTTEGKGVAGVKVAVAGLMAFERLDDFLRVWQREMRHADEGTGTRRLILPLNNVLRITPGDKDGRFEIRGIGAERLAGIGLKSAGLADEPIMVITRQGFDAKALRKSLSEGGGGRGPVVFGPSFEHVAEPTRAVEGARPIEGTVRQAGSRKPVAGAIIQAQGITAVSDARGRYRLLGLRRSPQHTLNVTAPRDLPLIGRWVRVADGSGLEPIRVDVELPRGVVVTGRVIDKATGQGVESEVHFSPLPGNKFALKTSDLALYASTDARGRFRLVTIPGPGLLLAQVMGTFLKIDGIPICPYKPAELDAADRPRVKMTGNLKPYRGFLVAGGGTEILDYENACKVLDLKEGGEAVSCDLVVDPGKRLTLNLQDPRGEPLAGALAAGVSAQALRALPVRSAACPVYALDPQKPRQLVFLHAKRKLAAVVTVRGDEKEPVTVRLAPTGVLTGRVLDADGQAVAEAEVHVIYSGQVGQQLAKMSSRLALPQTDKEGRFRLEEVVPGLKVDFIGFLKGRQVLVPKTKLGVKPLESGKTLDLGDLRTKPRGR